MADVAIPNGVDAALETALAGRRISAEDAISLMNGAPLEALCEAASSVRNRFKGFSVTYSKKVFIPLTHPNLLSEYYPELLKAGINDWGGIPPVTKDFINPEADWPQVSSLAARTAAAGFVLRERLSIYPEFSSCREFLTDRLRMRVESPRDEHGLARSNPC